jgi:hypothetical protein
VAKSNEKEDLVMKYGNEKGKGRLGDEVTHFITQSSFCLSRCHTSSPSLPFPFSLPHFITQSSFSFLFATFHHPGFLFLSQRERKRKTG